jgi:hypothetical protein
LSQSWDGSTSATRTSSTGTRVDVSVAAAEASESRAAPAADRGDVGAGHTAIEGQEAGDATEACGMDFDQTR